MLQAIREIAEAHEMNFHYPSENLLLFLWMKQPRQMMCLILLMCFTAANDIDTLLLLLINETDFENIPSSLTRTSAFLSHPVFNTHHSETE